MTDRPKGGWMEGTAQPLSPVSHSNTSRSWASESSGMWKRVDRAFLWCSYAALECSMSGKMCGSLASRVSSEERICLHLPQPVAVASSEKAGWWVGLRKWPNLGEKWVRRRLKAVGHHYIVVSTLTDHFKLWSSVCKSEPHSFLVPHCAGTKKNLLLHKSAQIRFCLCGQRCGFLQNPRVVCDVK